MQTIRSLIVVCLLAASVMGTTLAPAPAAPGKLEPQRLRWRPAPVRIAVSTSLTQTNPNIQYGSDVLGAIRRSLETWQAAGDLDLQFELSDRRNVSPAGAGDGVSLITIAASPENVLLFAKDPFGEAARTRVFYNRLGYITEADIVLNPYQQFSTDGTFGTFDLESTVTHEIGHLLGLRHSGVLGATMSESFSKNGFFGSVDTSARSLSASDIAAIRELYGAGDDGTCCGSIGGKLTLPGAGRGASNVRVWAEDGETGIVTALSVTAADGSFRLGGLRSGEYSLFWQRRSVDGVAFGALGVVRVEKGASATVNEKLAPRRSRLFVDFAGINGQLSESAVGVKRGGEYVLYLGGKGLDIDSINVGVRSSFVTIDPATIRAQEFADGVQAVSVIIRISEDAPRGSYTLFVNKPDGSQAALIGALDIQ